MMSAAWHESQSRHNMDLYYFLHTRHPEYIDWQITALFYAALHLVDAYLERHGIEPGKNHPARNKLVERELPLLHRPYERLYALSIKARYVFGNRLNDTHRQDALDYFSRIKDHIDSL